MSYSGQDRRVHSRWPFAGRVELGYDGKWQACDGVNLSFGGILLSTPSPPPEGSRVSLRIVSEHTTEPLQLDGLVIRCSLDRGVGIGFFDLSEDSKTALRRMIEMLGGAS